MRSQQSPNLAKFNQNIRVRMASYFSACVTNQHVDNLNVLTEISCLHCGLDRQGQYSQTDGGQIVFKMLVH